MPMQPAMIGTLQLDAAISEGATFAAQVTDHPVEVGSNVVDHIRPQPIEVRIDGIVTDTPATVSQARRASDATGQGDGEVAAYPGRAQAALTFLIDLRDNPRLVTVSTTRWVYEEMALVSLTVPTDRTTGDALRFSAAFRQVRTVTLRRVQLAVRPSRSSLKAKVPAATKPTSTTPPALEREAFLFKFRETDIVQSVRRIIRGAP